MGRLVLTFSVVALCACDGQPFEERELATLMKAFGAPHTEEGYIAYPLGAVLHVKKGAPPHFVCQVETTTEKARSQRIESKRSGAAGGALIVENIEVEELTDEDLFASKSNPKCAAAINIHLKERRIIVIVSRRISGRARSERIGRSYLREGVLGVRVDSYPQP